MWGWFKSKAHEPAVTLRADSMEAVGRAIASGRRSVKDLPEFIVAVDVETTGLHSNDRIVSLGAVWVARAALIEGCVNPSYLHLIFDPGRKSHPMAEKVHGYDDWLLRHQEPFAVYADWIAAFLNAGDVVVAHNAEFDLGFITRELAAHGLAVDRPVECTMEGYRAAHEGSASLTNVCRTIGLQRAGKLHGALEDAWLALMAYLWLHDYGHCCGFERCGSFTEIFNMLPAPGRPDGPLPRRKRRTPATAGSQG